MPLKQEQSSAVSLKYHGDRTANQRDRREERGHKSEGVNSFKLVSPVFKFQTKSNLIKYE